MLKKFLHNIYSLIFYFFSGMKAADKRIMAASNESGNDSGSHIEVQDEEESVYKDLLKGEITQEVRELRHEMYYSERESHKYKYIGAGVAEKKNEVFSNDMKYIEKSDGFPVQLIQDNLEDSGDVDEAKNEPELGKKTDKRYTISIVRDFTPSFRIEEFTNKVVVKRVDEEHAMLDLYVTKYRSQFKHRQKVFINRMEEIYMGDKLSDILQFNGLSFVTNKATGAPDMVKYEYNNITFDTITEYNGDYVLKFFADIVCDGEDLVSEFYDDIAAKKFENKERREKQPVFDMYDMAAVEDEKTKKGTVEEEAQRILDSLR